MTGEHIELSAAQRRALCEARRFYPAGEEFTARGVQATRATADALVRLGLFRDHGPNLHAIGPNYGAKMKRMYALTPLGREVAEVCE